MKELRILNGCKKSVSFVLDDEPVKIGSALTSELVVQDKELVSEHVEISLNEKGNVSLKPLKGSIRNVRGVVFRNPMTLKEGVPFQLGSTWFVVQKPNEPWPQRLPKVVNQEKSSKFSLSKVVTLCRGLNTQKVMLQGIFVLLAYIGINTFAVSKNKSNLDHDDHIKLSPESVQASIGEAVLMQPDHVAMGDEVNAMISEKAMIPQSTVPEESLATISAMLDERELYKLDVTLLKDKVIIEGNLDVTQNMVLARTLLRYENQFPHLMPIENATQELTKELPFSIASIVAGTFGHITTSDGQKLSVGKTKQGFTLISIKDGVLTFEGEQRVEVKW